MRHHHTFKSNYRDNFEIVEQVKGGTRLYPHTEQLPAICRALNFEFTGVLPQRIVHTDARADSYRKLLLHAAVTTYCDFVNVRREDDLYLFPCLNPELVTRIGILQQVTTIQERGNHHSFRLFSGDRFLPDIHLSGKRVGFATHVLDRFSTRVPFHLGDHVADLMFTVLRSPAIVMSVGKSDALVFPHYDSIIALTFEDHGDEYFFTTCLTPKEIRALDYDTPPRVLNFHFGREFTFPTRRNWDYEKAQRERSERWRQRKPFITEIRKWDDDPAKAWRFLGGHIKEVATALGRTEDIHLEFLDHVYGPTIVFIENEAAKPVEVELQTNVV